MNRNDAIQSIRDVCRLKHYALTTEETYCHWVNRYCLWLAKNHASVTVSDIVSASDSKWFPGPFGWVMRDPRQCEFHSTRGRLGIFHPDSQPDSIL
jgi:hypothetical protein